MRKSVLIDGRLVGYRHGGIPSYAKKLATLTPALAPDLDVRVALRRPVPELSDRSVRVFTPPHHPLERYAFGVEAGIRGFDLIHAVDYVQPIAPGVRSVVTVHDLAFLTRPDLLASDAAAYYGRIRYTIHRADGVIAVSNWTRRQLIEQLDLDESRICVAPNGVDHGLFNPDPNGDDDVIERLHPRLGGLVRTSRPVVLAVGTLEPRKRIDLLIEAFRRFNPEVRSDLAGTPLLIVAGQRGWLADDMVEHLRRLQRTGMAIWLRDVSDRELAALYRVSTLLAMPSIDEGFGLPVLEAMACGTPVLAATNGALPELAGDAGFLEASDSAETWSHRIRGILNDRAERQIRAERGLARARTYSWERTAELTVKVYRKVLEER